MKSRPPTDTDANGGYLRVAYPHTGMSRDLVALHAPFFQTLDKGLLQGSQVPSERQAPFPQVQDGVSD